jgi:hypothetical protein
MCYSAFGAAPGAAGAAGAPGAAFGSTSTNVVAVHSAVIESPGPPLSLA